MKQRPKPGTGTVPASWTVEFLNEGVEEEFRGFSEKIQAKMFMVFDLIGEFGLDHVGAPHVEQVRGKLWEIKARDGKNWGRCLYVTLKGKRTVVVLRCFLKKTNETPEREIRLASKRLKEIE